MSIRDKELSLNTDMLSFSDFQLYEANKQYDKATRARAKSRAAIGSVPAKKIIISKKFKPEKHKKKVDEAYIYDKNVVDFGFVTPTGKVIKAKNEPDHDTIAIKNGFSDGAEEAVANGSWIRFAVRRDGEASITFVNLPKIVKLAIDFIKKNPMIHAKVFYDLVAPKNIDRILKTGSVEDPKFFSAIFAN